ncbi:hypothetical protein GCM10010342_48080 [Streptomyces anulatus]|nr:hypothetical protein GCM10010342_48080 [Streptomyces anulatus]
MATRTAPIAYAMITAGPATDIAVLEPRKSPVPSAEPSPIMVVCRWVRERTSPPPAGDGLAPSASEGGASGAESLGAAMAVGPFWKVTGVGGEATQNSLVRNGFAGAFRSGLPRTFGEDSA